MSFKTVLLENLAAPARNSIVGGPFGSNLVSKDYVAAGVPVIRGQNMGGRWVGGDFAFVSAEKAEILSPNKARPGDLVFTQRGTLGQVSIVPPAPFSEYIVSQSQMKVTVDPTKADVNFLYYVFCSQEQLDYIQNTAIQTGVPHTNLGILKKTPVQLPPLGTQRQIASLLGLLDDRITLLRETNATLEAIAQALFKSWFVDFDPVRAKQEGRAPEGMSDTTAALFPDSFEASELGLVPKGWRVVRLDSFVELAYGKALKAENRKAGSVPVYGSGGITGWHNQALVDQTSIIVGRKGTVGSLYWESRPFFPIDTVFYVKSRKPLTYCYLLLKTLGLDSMNTDAAVPGLNRENVYRLLVTEPPENILAAFDDIASVLRASMDENDQQAQTLAALRDTLLPRLISGQLRLPEAEALIEEATA